jgi:hypothetical protein
MEGVWDGVIHLGKVHSILKILHIQVGLIIDYVFDYVEIDSSFYRVPNVFMVNNWNTKTLKNFKFIAKFPRVIQFLRK